MNKYRGMKAYLIILMILLMSFSTRAVGQDIPEEARRFMARGMRAVEMAKTPKDYERAVREFEQAAELAPNWPDVYFNLGSVQAKAGNYGKAVRNYKRYLELAPNASDAAKVREEIYKLEYQAEQQEEARPKEIKRDVRFISYNNGTVLDTSTNLMWASRDSGSVDWYGAKSYCENYRGGGYTDWRMPTQDEVAGLYDAGKSRPMKCDTSHSISIFFATDLIDMACCCLWASETRGSEAAAFHFRYGLRGWTPQSFNNGSSRGLPVRSGK